MIYPGIFGRRDAVALAEMDLPDRGGHAAGWIERGRGLHPGRNISLGPKNNLALCGVWLGGLRAVRDRAAAEY